MTPRSLREWQDDEAIKEHGNNPDKRLNEWGFTGSQQERDFILKHDFGHVLEHSLEKVRTGKWIYAYGKPGLGKTALMTRVIWELLKDKPSRRASFIAINDYCRNIVKRAAAEDAAIRRGEFFDPDAGAQALRGVVLLDDLDKANFANEHICRTVLGLIERLKAPVKMSSGRMVRRFVLITSQLSIEKLEARHNNPDMEPLCDRLRQMCFVLPEFKGRSKR